MFVQTTDALKSIPFSGVVKPRLAYYQGLMREDDPDLAQIVEHYQDWVSYPEYMIFKGEQIHSHEQRFKAVKCAKRGNDVYNWRIKKRFDELRRIQDVVFFDPHSNLKTTRGLFVTYTIPRILAVNDAWRGIGELWNRQITRLRERFGDIQVIRVWESHKDGYPHIHALLVFRDSTFDVFRWSGTWRIQEKACFEGIDGFTDVQALRSLKDGLSYLTKYLIKLHVQGVDASELEDPGQDPELQAPGLYRLPFQASILSLALMWIFQKRAFAVSRGLLDLIALMRNSKVSRPGQVDLQGDPVWVWVLMGFYGGDLSGKWQIDLSFNDYRELKSSGSFTSRVKSFTSCVWAQ